MADKFQINTDPDSFQEPQGLNFDIEPYHGLEPEPELKPEDYTCNECAAKHNCEWAFDDYNTNGDCLAEK